MSLGSSVRDIARGQYWIHPSLAEVVENALLKFIDTMSAGTSCSPNLLTTSVWRSGHESWTAHATSERTVRLTKRSLVLPASPPSVKLARSWVSEVLAEIGRDDLVDAAAARRLRAGHQRADPLAPAAVGAHPGHRRPPPHRGRRLLARPAAAGAGGPGARGRRRLQPDHLRPRAGPGGDDVAAAGAPTSPTTAAASRSGSSPPPSACGPRAPATARSSTSTPTSRRSGDRRHAPDRRCPCSTCRPGCSRSCVATTSRCAASSDCWR